MYATLTLPAGQDLTALPRAPTVQVRSVDEIRNALRRARGQALTLDASCMDRILRVDASQGLLEVQAATTWAELARYLAGHGIALDAFARLNGLPSTVGETVSLASPGPDGLPVPAHVVAATLVTPEGEFRRTGRDSNPELLKALLGGQGLLGVLYSLTLSSASMRRSAQNAALPVELEIVQGEAVAPAGTLECLLPPAELDAYLKEVRLLLDERRLALRGITVRRYLADPSCLLNWATREWAGVEIRFCVKAVLGASVTAAEVRRALLAAALARGGSFPIRDTRDATRRQLETCYPALGEFLAEKRRADPDERLQNDWYRRIGASLRAESCEVRWNRG
jgi:FAD/FMN-containing dehydrogenase